VPTPQELLCDAVMASIVVGAIHLGWFIASLISPDDEED